LARQYVFLFLKPIGLFRITATVGSRNYWAAFIAGHNPRLAGKSENLPILSLTVLSCPLAQIPMPVWTIGIALFAPRLDDRLPLRLAVSECPKDKALIALLNNLNADWFLNHLRGAF
jgi:hypothetical protein